MKESICFDHSFLKEFDIEKGIKQGSILAPTSLRIFFIAPLKHAFGLLNEGIYLCSRADSKPFNASTLKARIKTRRVLIREHLFVHNAALVLHSQAGLPHVMVHFALACNDVGLKISLKKTNVLGQSKSTSASIKIKKKSA